MVNVKKQALRLTTQGLKRTTHVLNLAFQGLNLTTHDMNLTTHVLNLATHDMNLATQGLNLTTQGLNLTTQGINLTALALFFTFYLHNLSPQQLKETIFSIVFSCVIGIGNYIIICTIIGSCPVFIFTVPPCINIRPLVKQCAPTVINLATKVC